MGRPLDPGRKNTLVAAAALAAILPLLVYALGWSVYRDPVDEGLHLERQISMMLPCANGDMRVISTTIRFGPSDQARRQRLQAIEDGRATLDCAKGGAAAQPDL